MSKVLIETIPHTGTRFFAQLLQELDHTYTIKHFPTEETGKNSSARCVTMLRDPCLVAISNMRGFLFRESIGSNIKTLNKRYDVFIRRAAKRKYVYVDIDCPTEKRESHLTVVLKQLNLYNESCIPAIQQYATNWTPVGKNDNDWKLTYLETGQLPDCIQRCDLQRAIAWNEKLKQDCIYDNIT